MSDDSKIRRLASNVSDLISRLSLAGLGKRFDGDRDMYKVLGYPSKLEVIDYQQMYERNGIAARIIDLPAIYSWQETPIITGENGEENQLSREIKILDSRLSIFNKLERIDRLSGIANFGVLLLGVNDEKTLNEPLEGTFGIDDLLYITPLSQNNVSIYSIDNDPMSPRFGFPDIYTVNLGESPTGQKYGTYRVHFSRIVHVAENTIDSEVLGTPRLQKVFNYLLDLEKISGSAPEALWKMINGGLHIDIDPDFSFTEEQLETLRSQLEEFDHGLRRHIRTQGVDINNLQSGTPNPTAVFKMTISLIAATIGIPQRILIGTESGSLASDQDQNSWFGEIASRQNNYVEPRILRRFIDKLILLGMLPNEQYSVSWPPLFTESKSELLDISIKQAQIIKSLYAERIDEIISIDEAKAELLHMRVINE